MRHAASDVGWSVLCVSGGRACLDKINNRSLHRQQGLATSGTPAQFIPLELYLFLDLQSNKVEKVEVYKY